jgi:transposase-like protein
MERGREVWEPRVRRLRESGLTVAEFAAELGVNPKTLTYWKWRLGKEASAGRPRRSRQCELAGRHASSK